MHRSISSRILEELIRLSGRKKEFLEKDEATFLAWQKEMIAISDQPYANPKDWVGQEVAEVYYDGMQTFIWNDKNSSEQGVIFYTHGGGYVHQPQKPHFTFLAKLVKDLDVKVVFPIYPKYPKYNHTDVLPKLETAYRELMKTTQADKVTLMGDSAGGGLALAFAMYLRDKGFEKCKDVVLISPWVDVTMDNPAIVEADAKDPMLAAWLPRKIGLAWAGESGDRKNPYVSPLFGDLTGLGKISIFIGTHDILYPDVEKLHQRLLAEGVDHNYTCRPEMNHVYVLYPLMPEAKADREAIIKIIKQG